MMANGDMISSNSMATKFIGVYSGRTATENQLDAQLGFVWLSFSYS
jgi:hypothetical protein